MFISETILATGSVDKTIRIWNTGSGSSIRELRAHTDWIQALALSPDRLKLASGSFDKTVKIFSLSTFDCLKTIEFSGQVWSASFTGLDTLLVGGEDVDLASVDIQSGKVLKKFAKYGNPRAIVVTNIADLGFAARTSKLAILNLMSAADAASINELRLTGWYACI